MKLNVITIWFRGWENCRQKTICCIWSTSVVSSRGSRFLQLPEEENKQKEEESFHDWFLRLVCRIGRVVVPARTNARNNPIFQKVKRKQKKKLHPASSRWGGFSLHAIFHGKRSSAFGIQSFPRSAWFPEITGKQCLVWITTMLVVAVDRRRQ